MKSMLLLAGLSFLYATVFGQATLQERLGYSKDSKLLIVHADDLGVSHSENVASIKAMEAGSVSSASIMVPCPWFSEIAAYAVQHPQADLGLHLTLTSEWKYYRWDGITSRYESPTLHNASGYLYSSVDSFQRAAKMIEVEKELRSQIEKAKAAGIDVTHLDTHMGSLFASADYLRLLIRLGREYKVPVLFNEKLFKAAMNIDLKGFATASDVQVDMIYTATEEDYRQGMPAYYERVIRSIQPGVSEIIIHTAHDDAEMQAITVDHPAWGAAWRQADFDYFTSEACKKLLEDQHIRLITWREIRDKLVRKNK